MSHTYGSPSKMYAVFLAAGAAAVLFLSSLVLAVIGRPGPEAGLAFLAAIILVALVKYASWRWGRV